MSETEDEPESFIKHLQEEKLKTQAARMMYVTRKLAYATGFLGLGSLKIGTLDLSLLLYLVPFLALAFDLYILGEDYSVKRIGAFLRAASDDPLERRWEGWVVKNRDPFAQYALPLLTNLLATAAALVLWSRPNTLNMKVFIGWLPLAFLPIWALFFYYRKLRKRAVESAADNSFIEPISFKEVIGVKLSRFVQSFPYLFLKFHIWKLRINVKKEGYILNEKSYEAVKRLFRKKHYFSRPKAWVRLVPEYGHKEYLRNVDSCGEVVPLEKEVVEDFRNLQKEETIFGTWFKEGAEGSTLLPARWLCHLAGFRHLSAHLFLESDGDNEHILIQVRGTKKAESPGSFDLPVAGHVKDEEDPKEAVLVEAQEELGLNSDELNLTNIGGYPYEDPNHKSWFRNIEFRWVFRASLDQSALAKVRPRQGEVAAIALFLTSEIDSMIADCHDRVASGLQESMKFYKEQRIFLRVQRGPAELSR